MRLRRPLRALLQGAFLAAAALLLCGMAVLQPEEIRRGFLYAGASSVVASLWKVDDLATSQLMTRLYENLRRTDKREALLEAQLHVRAAHPHPFFWAAFQLTGSDR